MPVDLVRFEDELRELERIAFRLRMDAGAVAVALFGATGEPLATVGDTEHLRPEVLGSLAVGNEELEELAAGRTIHVLTSGSAYNLHRSLVGRRAFLAVLSDDDAPIGLARVAVKRRAPEFERVIEGMVAKDAAEGGSGDAGLPRFPARR